MSSLKKLIIADLNLISYEGHNFEYSLSLQAEAHKQNIDCSIWGNIQMNARIVRLIQAMPVFHLTYGEPLPGPHLLKPFSDLFYYFRWFGLHRLFRKLEHQATFRGHNRALYSDLERIGQSTKLDSSTFILFHTIQSPQIEPICRWWNNFPRETRPHLGLFFRFEPNCETDHPVRAIQWTRRAYDLLHDFYKDGDLHLLTDSKILGQRYEALIRCPFSVVPIPQSVPRADFPVGHALNQPIRLGYLGNARDNKGFPQLPQLVKDCAEWISRKKMEFIFQLCVSSNPEPASQAALDALQKLPITPFLGELDSRGYYDLLQQMDVVLLPYDLNYYSSQTSGIFSDALAYGKIVVVPKDTWMADQLLDHGSGVIYDSEKAKGLLTAASEVLDHYEKLKTRALQAVYPWLSAHSAQRYLERIQELCDQD
jgi:glycosyltransferase involved in cell wall biosynthesis